MRTTTNSGFSAPSSPRRFPAAAAKLLALTHFALSGACGADTQDDDSPITTQQAGSAPINSGGTAGPPLSGGAAPPSAGTTAGSVSGGSSGAMSTAGSGGVAAHAGSGGTGGVGGSGGDMATAGSGGGEPDLPCDPADELPEATAINNIGMGSEPAGMFNTVVESDPGIADQTIFRPEPLGMIQHPVLAWGNGGCTKSNSGFAEFLLQLAAEGILVIADGTPGGSGSSAQDGAQLIKAIDWAEAENERPCSKYYHKLDMTKVAVSGQSCGGLMALNASDDERVAASMPMNSGLFARDQALYGALHAPMAIINGGPDDIAYANGNADFEAIDTIPLMLANIPVGHGGTYRQDNGGEMGKMAIAWARWHLLSDEGATGKGMFIGDSCGFCNSEWEMMWKMKPQ